MGHESHGAKRRESMVQAQGAHGKLTKFDGLYDAIKVTQAGNRRRDE